MVMIQSLQLKRTGLFVVAFTLASGFTAAQNGAVLPPGDAPVCKNEISAGTGASISQSVYSIQANRQVELTYSRLLSEKVKATVGYRHHVKPQYAGGFVRFSLFNRFGAWKPSAGVETGLSGLKFTYSDNLLRETKSAMDRNPGRVYLSIHIAPLCFSLGRKWNVSMLELNLGSHFRHMGRTVFIQAGFLNFVYTFYDKA